MKLQKRTYSLPPETIRRFEARVQPGRRSAILARIIEEWTEAEENARLRREIAEGCKEMADTYQEMEKDFHPLEEEAHRAFGE